jgi:GTP pyrophosphokinase
MDGSTSNSCTTREQQNTNMSHAANSIPRFGEIQDIVKQNFPDADLEIIRQAYVYSAMVHAGQVRRSGEPYLVHPVAVAKILAEMKLDEDAVATGLLHDTVEDTLASLEEIGKQFGKKIASLVDGVTKISKMEFLSKEERQAESFRKLILAMSEDIRVLLVKLVDRLHNMRTLGHMPRNAQRRIARETMDIYAPLAARLGIYWMRTELETLAFKYIDPENYNHLINLVEETIKQTDDYRIRVQEIIREKLEKYGIRAETKGRTKDLYSIHRKMIMQHLSFEEVHDLTAFRVIVDSVADCYAVLGILHGLWKPVPGRFKDYIAMPKPNGYQSLHTTVVGLDGHRIEIQIRTQEMDLVAEQGIAAHWSYKEGQQVEQADAQIISWLRQVIEYQAEVEDPREFLETVRVDLYPDEVYVFTPKGEVKEFPKGATPLDFAFSIHTEVGLQCQGARINGKLVPLSYQLQNGDVVEIVNSPQQRPSKDWLKIVKTAKARTKIRHYIQAQERTQAVDIGRDSAERELKRRRLELSTAEKKGDILRIAEDYGFVSEEDLYAAIGFGRVSPKAIITKLLPVEEREEAKSELQQEKKLRKAPYTSKSGVRVQGLTGVMVNFAKCCSPLPGDQIRGFITRGRGVTVHTADCANLAAVDRRRLIDVSWELEEEAPHMVKLSVLTRNEMGMLAKISGVFSSNDSDILEANIKSTGDDQARGTFTVGVKNIDHLNRIMIALKNIKGVEDVQRL